MLNQLGPGLTGGTDGDFVPILHGRAPGKEGLYAGQLYLQSEPS